MNKILNYNYFLSEKLLKESLLLLESIVAYSPKFKKALQRLPDNEVAKALLEIENEDLDVVSNFFDILIDNDNELSFTNDRTAQAIIRLDKDMVKWTGRRGNWLTNTAGNLNIFRRMGYEPVVDTPVYHPQANEYGEVMSKWTSPRTNKTWCYVKFENGEGVYSQERLANAHEELKNKVFTSSRQTIRIGRAVRALLNAKGLRFNDAQLETFVNEFRGVIAVMNDVFSRFEIVDGEDLLYWYKRENYESPNRGSLGGSCQAVGRRDWLEIYIDNPDTVKLLILKSLDNPDKIIGRALLWTLDNGGVLMDCIYTSADSDVNVFREYARSKGWNYIYEGGGGTYVAHTKVKPEGYRAYPSVDNMRYWNRNTGKISNRGFEGSRQIIWSADDGDDEDWDDED